MSYEAFWVNASLAHYFAFSGQSSNTVNRKLAASYPTVGIGKCLDGKGNLYSSHYGLGPEFSDFDDCLNWCKQDASATNLVGIAWEANQCGCSFSGTLPSGAFSNPTPFSSPTGSGSGDVKSADGDGTISCYSLTIKSSKSGKGSKGRKLTN